jgi:hypothetical protein
MATTKKRLNISLSKEMEQALATSARRDAMPQATKASLLLQLALEIEEDQVFERIVGARDTKNAKFVAHEQAWK